MKTISTHVTVVFLIGFVLLGQSCMEENISEEPPFPSDVTNRYTALLQKHLQINDIAYNQFTEILSGRTPLYEQVRFSTHSDYGLYWKTMKTLLFALFFISVVNLILNKLKS